MEGYGSGAGAGSESIPLTNGSVFRIREAQKLADPDPDHWFKCFLQLSHGYLGPRTPFCTFGNLFVLKTVLVPI
jgi:hypothetical protein